MMIEPERSAVRGPPTLSEDQMAKSSETPVTI
jgi:hypothetical protein